MKIDLDKYGWLALLLSLCFLLLFSCKSKKSVTERTKITDTIEKTSLRYVSKPIQTDYILELYCDTVTGKVKPVNFEERSGENLTRLKIENNKLTAQLETAQSETKVDTIYKTKTIDVFKDKEVVQYKTALWHWMLHLVLLVCVFLLLKRYIPFL